MDDGRYYDCEIFRDERELEEAMLQRGYTMYVDASGNRHWVAPEVIQVESAGQSIEFESSESPHPQSVYFKQSTSKSSQTLVEGILSSVSRYESSQVLVDGELSSTSIHESLHTQSGYSMQSTSEYTPLQRVYLRQSISEYTPLQRVYLRQSTSESPPLRSVYSRQSTSESPLLQRVYSGQSTSESPPLQRVYSGQSTSESPPLQRVYSRQSTSESPQMPYMMLPSHAGRLKPPSMPGQIAAHNLGRGGSSQVLVEKSLFGESRCETPHPRSGYTGQSTSESPPLQNVYFRQSTSESPQVPVEVVALPNASRHEFPHPRRVDPRRHTKSESPQKAGSSLSVAVGRGSPPLSTRMTSTPVPELSHHSRGSEPPLAQEQKPPSSTTCGQSCHNQNLSSHNQNTPSDNPVGIHTLQFNIQTGSTEVVKVSDNGTTTNVQPFTGEGRRINSSEDLPEINQRRLRHLTQCTAAINTADSAQQYYSTLPGDSNDSAYQIYADLDGMS